MQSQKIKLINKYNSYIFYLILLLFSFSIAQNEKNNYFFTMYPSKENKTSHIIHSFTPYSEHITIDFSLQNPLIKKESISEYVNNISSMIFYKEEYLIKTCFSTNKIVEIIPANELNKSYEQIQRKYIYNENSLQISKNLKYCYSSIISSPDTIITYWVQIQKDGSYSHKTIFFDFKEKKFSPVYNLVSNDLFPLNKRYPIHCTTFRNKDIFCSYYDLDLNNQYVIETNKIKNKQTPNVYFVLSDFGQINGKNMLPISLNKQMKSIFGGYYDIFLAEFSEKKESNNKLNNTIILYSLYRKSLHASLVPMFSFLDLFFGINIRDDYIETNMFNYILEGNEIIFVFIYNNMLQAIRVDYSKKYNIFKKYEDFRELGYFSTKISSECKNPKFMQSTYINTTINFSQEEKLEEKNILWNYKKEKDIASIISCEDNNGNINYISKLIEMPQCLIDLDNINSHEIHKINFFISIGNIIYGIYDDLRLKSFRNKGIMFYPPEDNYKDLIEIQIKYKNKNFYVIPVYNTIYYDITHIKFRRLKSRYVPYFTKPFYLKYRLFNTISNNENDINKLSSSICYFQIKFFPWDQIKKNPDELNVEIITDFNLTNKTQILSPELDEPIDDECSIDGCSICAKTGVKNNYKGFICEKCDRSELEVMIPDTNIKSETYGACICNTSLGFKKDPEINTCYCQDDYAYYKNTNLCWPLRILKNGPYYTDTIDDITEIPIYDDCYSSCAKCSKPGNATNHNCDKCKEGFVHIDDDISNCYNKSELNEGYHEIDKDKYIKCHENCISCVAKPIDNKQFCTECRNNVSYYIRENPNDEYFNCFKEKCDNNNPSLLFKYDIDSKECLKNCENGFTPYNNEKICLMKCNNEFPFLDKEEKKCYSNCEKNEKNKINNYQELICTNDIECLDQEKCLPECGNERKYKNKKGICVPIPDKCLVIDKESELCKICNEGYYPLKEELNLPNFNCYKNLEEIIKIKNKSNYYLNETEGYWDECYPSCETCYGYGSENRQRCIKCKKHFFMLENNYNIYNNCLIELTPNENCTSSQLDMYKYHDFCYKCKSGYAFVYGFEQCFLEKELKEGPYFSKYMIKMMGPERDTSVPFPVYFNCYKSCKSCSIQGDLYDNNCTSCIEGYIFNPKSKFQNCVSPSDLISDTTNNINIIEKTDNINLNKESEYNNYNTNEIMEEKTDNKEKENEEKTEENSKEKTEEISEDINIDINKIDNITYNITEEELIEDSDANTWFNLGNNSFYIYKQGNCYLVFYHSDLILISSKDACSKICPIWSITHCPLKRYHRFNTLSKKEFYNLISNTNVYSEIKKDINIFISEDESKIYFQITNNVSPAPKNISYIDLSEYDYKIKSKYGENLLLIKADIKRSDTQSTQVEYQFYNPNDFFEKIDLDKNILSSYKRRLNDDNSNAKVNIDLPVDWTEKQLENINFLTKQNINVFNSADEFYTDNCYQFTSSKGGDVFLEERKKEYYPDIPLCEEGCTFVKYNIDTEKVTCKCDYKINSENYTNVTFIKNEKDKKFLKDLIMENIQAMKCIKVIFKWTNLKSNPGFIIMIIFLILFACSSIIYFFSDGFRTLNGFIKKSIDDKNIKDIIKRSTPIDDIIDNGNNDDPKKISKFQGGNNEGDSSKNSGDNDIISKEDGDDNPGDIVIGKGKNGKKGGKKGTSSNDSFSFHRDDYDKDSTNSVLKKSSINNGNKNPKNKNNNPKDSTNPDDNNPKDNNNPDKNDNPKDDKSKNQKDENNNNPEKKEENPEEDVNNPGEGENNPGEEEKDPKKRKRPRKVKFKGDDKISEGGKPDKPNYDEDSINSGYKKDKNNRDSDDSDNEEEKEDKENDKDKKDDKEKEGDKDKEEDMDKEDEKKDKDPTKRKRTRKMKSKGDKTSEVGKPDNPNYDEDSINSGYKKDKNNRDSDDSDNEEEKENKENDKHKKDDKVDDNNEEDNNDDDNNKNTIDENKKEENKEKTKKNKKKKKKLDKSIISDAQKAANYSEDSKISGLKGKVDDMISDISSEKDDIKKTHKDKSLISENSKKKDDNEEEISVGNISKINHMFEDSKNDDDIIKVMGDNNNDKNNNKNDNNIDINLNINDIVSNKGDNKEEKDADVIKINDINNDESLDLSKLDKNNKNKKKEEEKKKKEENKKKMDVSYMSKFSSVKKAKEEGCYDNDSNILPYDDSESSKHYNLDDLISQNSDKANPPKKDKFEQKLMINDTPEMKSQNENPEEFKIKSKLWESKQNMKSSSEKIESENMNKNEEFEENDENNKKINVKKILNMNDETLTLDEFSKKYPKFFSIYLSDLKKHHIIYFSFSYSKYDINNIFLRLSLFSISIVLYFSLNTIFMVNSKMANAYFDRKNSGPEYVIINLFLPYIICSIIILLLKKYIMLNSYITKIVRTIQTEKGMKEVLGFSQMEEIMKNKNMPKEDKKRSIKNIKNKMKEQNITIKMDYNIEKGKLMNKVASIYPKYKTIVIIYFFVGLIFLGINWYMITSFCAVYENTGIKLIVNSIVSLIVSFIIPCLLGFIPTLFGFLAKKLKNEFIYKVYKIINKVL